MELFLHCYGFKAYFEYFAVILGGFLAFWKNVEIQDSGCFDIMM